MNWTKYTRVPYTILALRWTGENLPEILEFTHNAVYIFPDPETQEPTKQLLVRTSGDNWLADPGDWVICYDDGQLAVVYDSVFKECYRLCNKNNLRSIR